MKAPSKHSDSEVEVIETEDIWAQFGSKLPDQLPSPKQTPSSRTLKRVPVWSMAALLTITLHGLLLGSVLFGSPARKHQLATTTEGAAASAQNSKAAEFVSTLVLIQNHSITPEDQDDSAYALMQSVKRPDLKLPEISIISPEVQVEVTAVNDAEDDTVKSSTSTGDGAGEAMLFGRYMGQIKARIERAWNYPATLSHQSFQCTVQIKQNRKGEVVEVTMTRCDKDPAWQSSLAKAIQVASPLSAPPNEHVFTEVVILTLYANVPM